LRPGGREGEGGRKEGWNIKKHIKIFGGRRKKREHTPSWTK